MEDALLRLDNLQEGDVRVASFGGNAQAGLCVGENLRVVFTMPTGNQPPLVAVSSLLESGVPGGAIDVRSNDGTKERELCNAAGFCDADGLITIDIEATEPELVNGTCYCDLGWVFDQDLGSCGRPEYNTSAWTGIQRCSGYVTQDTAHDDFDFMNWRYVYVADAQNVTDVEVGGAVVNGTGSDIFYPGVYEVGPLEPNEEDVPLTLQLWNMSNTSVAGVALDLGWRDMYYVDRTIRGVRRAKMANFSQQLSSQEAQVENSVVVQGLSRTLDGIALNLLFGERAMYVTDPGRDGLNDGQIFLVDLEARGEQYFADATGEFGSGVTNLTTIIAKQVDLVDPQGIALDLLNRHMYWVDSGNVSLVDGKVYRANLDGTDAACVFDQGLVDPMGLVLDLRNYTMILTDEGGGINDNGRLIKANMAYDLDVRTRTSKQIAYYANRTWWQVIAESYDDLTGGDDGGVQPFVQPYGIALDTTNDMLYVTDAGTGHVIKLDINGSLGTFPPTLFMQQGIPMGIALDNGLGPSQDRRTYECYGHGYCGGPETNFKCICDDGWFGNCNMTTCPAGRAWFDQPFSTDEAHAVVECSNAGHCDHSTGLCECREGFEGGACERLSCPVTNGLTCSGHGECLTMRQLGLLSTYNGELAPRDYGSPSRANSTAWDADTVMGCHCHAAGFGNGTLQNLSAWTGYDCSRRECPTGDYAFSPYADPNQNGTKVLKTFEVQTIECMATGGTLTLTFRDQTTQPIRHNAYASQVKAALQALKSIGTVDVKQFDGDVSKGVGNATTGRLCDADSSNFTVTFTSELGDVPLLRVDGSDLEPWRTAVLQVNEYRKGTKDDLVCSDHGYCDHTTGDCDCFFSYTTSNANNEFGLRGDCGIAQTNPALWH